MSYVSLADFKSWVRNELGTADDPILQAGLDAAEVAINEHCGRNFNVAAGGSGRNFVPESPRLVIIDDCISVTSVAENGATIAASGYQLEPLNGRRPSGMQVPYDQIRRIYGDWYIDATDEGRATLHIHANWGWAATPAPVIEATKILAKDILMQRDTRNGVAAFGEFGSLRVRLNPYVEELLKPFVKETATPVDAIGVF
ncbi:MAG: hypothetical protein ACO3S5_05895 [Ilumatobacteraceae bacterium]